MKRSVGALAYAAFASAYKKKSTSADETLRRLALVEIRGRYQTRTLAI